MKQTAKAELFKKYGGAETQTGSVESQVALFTERIKYLSAHITENPKDNSTRRGLLHLVSKRKRLLSYLSKNNIVRYRKLIDTLGLRK